MSKSQFSQASKVMNQTLGSPTVQSIRKLAPCQRVVLCYHSLRVMGTSAADEQHLFRGRNRSVPSNRFEQQMEWLQSFADFTPLDELMRMSRKPRRWKVAVTFDDGYRDNIDIGQPVFERFRIPVTWFVTTDFVEQPGLIPWWDLLGFVSGDENGTFRCRLNGQVHSFDLSQANEQSRFVRVFSRLFRSSPPKRQSELYEMIYNQVDSDRLPPANGFANRQEIAQASQSPWVTLGAHTVSHPNLVQCTNAELDREIRLSRAKLEEWTGQGITWFAYPFGRGEHWNRTVIQAVQSAGFSGAVTTIPGLVKARTDPFQVPRIAVQPGWDLATFQRRVLHADMFRIGQRLKRSIKERLAP